MMSELRFLARTAIVSVFGIAVLVAGLRINAHIEKREVQSAIEESESRVAFASAARKQKADEVRKQFNSDTEKALPDAIRNGGGQCEGLLKFEFDAKASSNGIYYYDAVCAYRGGTLTYRVMRNIVTGELKFG